MSRRNRLLSLFVGICALLVLGGRFAVRAQDPAAFASPCLLSPFHLLASFTPMPSSPFDLGWGSQFSERSCP